MAKFRIVRANPFKYKREIITLWEHNLPETPPSRLEWMNNNPEGTAIWYLAIDQKTEIVAGSVSIMPRRVKLRGETYLAGIVGDFMVEEEYQVFGPALQLVKTVIKDHSRLGFDFLYTFPNQAAEKVILRAGFEKIGLAKRFVKPLNLGIFLKKHMHPTLVNIISPGLTFAMKIFSKETYMKTDLTVEEIAEPNTLHELSWKEIENQWSTIGRRSLDYIKWRYFQNPFHKFSMFIHRQPTDNLVLGYIIVAIANNRAHIFDILFNKPRDFRSILGRFAKDARKKGYDSISIRVLQDSPLSEHLKDFGFLDRNEAVPLLFTGDSRLLPTKWLFLDGDRNV